MRSKWILSSVFVLFLTAFCAVQAAHASTVYVGGCGSPSFTTIQLAVNAVSAGSTVNVCPGTYPGQVIINKNLTLNGIQSANNDAPVVVPPAGGMVTNGNDIFSHPVAAQIFVLGANPNVTISGLTVDGTGNNVAGCGPPTFEGIYFQNASGKIMNNAVRNQYQTDFANNGGCQNGFAINVESTTNTPNVTIMNNSVRAYQKNGITATGAGTGANSQGPMVMIQSNYIVGLGATPQNWPGGAAENGIQVGLGARGQIQQNTVNDNIWFGEYPQFDYDGQGGTTEGNAASGILIYASENIQVNQNNVGSNQIGIFTGSDPVLGPGDKTQIQNNQISGTQVFDAIDVCSGSNNVQNNAIYGSTQSGVHIDDTCGSGTSNNNQVQNNTINEACAGVLLGSGTGTKVMGNNYFNVVNVTLAGDSCPVAAVGAPALAGVNAANGARNRAARPSPYLPNNR